MATVSLAWSRLMAWLQVFWVCRVSLALAAAAYAFVAIQPASDLLLDVRVTGSAEFWLLFFLAFVVWSIVLYVSARLAVMDRAWATTRGEGSTVEAQRYLALHDDFAWPSRLVPILIPAIGAGFVIWALLAARENIPQMASGAQLAQALEGHLVRSAIFTALYTLAALLLILLYYRVIRLGGRGRSPRWPPFLPGLTVVQEGRTVRPEEIGIRDERRRVSPLFLLAAWLLFAEVSVVLLLFMLHPDLARMFQRAALAFVLLSIWVPLLTAASILSHRIRFPVIVAVAVAGAIVFTQLGDNHQIRSILIADGAPRPEERPTLGGWVERWKAAVGCPQGRGGPCQVRPILIAASGGASRAAFFTNSAVGRLMDLTACVEPGEGCPEAQPGFTSQVFAISSVSGSTLGATAWIIALERWAALGAPRDGLPCKARGTAALADGPLAIIERWLEGVSKIVEGRPRAPGETDAQAFEFWHGTGAGVSEGAAVGTWQDCLELAVVGDYLSPAIASLLVRDAIPFPFWEDRNRALEDAFDRHITAVLRPPPAEGDREALPLAMSRGFLELWAEQIAAADADGTADPLWRPLLVSNGSSVPFGNRILTSPIGPSQNGRLPLLDVTDAHGLVNNETAQAAAEQAGEPPVACGLPIKVAISNSARFPLVSTEGDFPEIDEGLAGVCVQDTHEWFGEEENADQIVDGGYYESIGLTSVFDLAVALRLQGLDPFVLVITNDPEVNPACTRVRNPLGESYAGALQSPIEAVLSARSARGQMSLEALRALTQLDVTVAADAELDIASARRRPPEPSHGDGILGQAPCISPDGGASAGDIAFIRVAPAINVAGEPMPSISLNWWLSRPVQILLRANVLAAHNEAAFSAVCEVMATTEMRRRCRARLGAEPQGEKPKAAPVPEERVAD